MLALLAAVTSDADILALFYETPVVHIAQLLIGAYITAGQLHFSLLAFLVLISRMGVIVYWMLFYFYFSTAPFGFPR